MGATSKPRGFEGGSVHPHPQLSQSDGILPMSVIDPAVEVPPPINSAEVAAPTAKALFVVLT